MDNNFLDVLADYQARHDFGKRFGVLAKVGAVKGLSNHLDQPNIKQQLNKCDNLYQMIQVIKDRTQELSKPRTQEQINEFKTQLERLIKIARL